MANHIFELSKLNSYPPNQLVKLTKDMKKHTTVESIRMVKEHVMFSTLAMR